MQSYPHRRTSTTPLLALLIGIAAIYGGCGSDLGDATGSTCPTDSKLTYSTFGEAFMQTYCLACHSDAGAESPKLSSLAQVRASRDEIDRAAAAGPDAVNTYMPEGTSVPEAERRKLGEWLACGAPE